jgi:hypothetical protein
VVARNDWSLGLSHEYRAGGTSGTLEASGFPYSDWGARWQDSRLASDGGESDLDLSSPDHQSLYLDHSYYNHEAGHSLDVRTFYQQPTGAVADAWGSTAEVLSDPQPIGRGHRLDFRLGGSLGVQKGGLGLVPADAGRTLEIAGLDGYLDFAPLKLGPRTTLTPAVSNTYNWDTSDVHTNALRGELRLDHSFGTPADFSLQMISQLSSGAFATTGWDNLIDLDARVYHGTTWMIFNSGSLDLTTQEWYDYATWDYYLNPTWRVELLGTWYSFAPDTTASAEQTASTAQQTLSDQEIYVGAKVYQDREIGLSWSRSTNRLSLELTGLTSTF